jgi:hypothetical protein
VINVTGFPAGAIVYPYLFGDIEVKKGSMNFDREKVMESAPDNYWMERLRKGHHVWLVKEEEFGVIEWEWDPPSPGSIAGRIGFRRFHDGDSVYAVTNETWYVTESGCGMDGKPLFLPIAGHLPEDPDPIQEPELRRLRRTLNSLNNRVSLLERSSNAAHGFWT